MAENKGITQYFGTKLATLLADKILGVYKDFPASDYVNTIKKGIAKKSYTQRIAFHGDTLYKYLPNDFKRSAKILVSILGEENQHETGMFTHYYWVMPIGKYVEKYGLEHFAVSMHAIEEITKRNTGEYAIRPFIRQYPKESLKQITEWAHSPNFHLRRLACEGLRPKLPWSTKLDTFNDNPKPVFKILEILKEDDVMFVKKSVANHLTDWLKVNPSPTVELIKKWQRSPNKHTQWIIKRATRKFVIP